jgi:hypothetical protein
MAVGSAVPAAASTAPTPPASHVTKPLPVRPPSSPGIAPGKAIPAKPPHHARGGGIRPDIITVTLSPSPQFLWPNQFSVLTATASQDVGHTPYYIRIYDLTAGAYVGDSCPSGTTCQASVTQPVPTFHNYEALISDNSASFPPGNVQSTSAVVPVVWEALATVSLSANPTTLPVGASSTLTATTTSDIGPTPFYTEIFDVTTGTRVAVCGSGATCPVSVSQSVAGTHEYIAYISNNDATFPPSGLLESSDPVFVTWTDAGWRISLTGPAEIFNGLPGTYTATANGDVGLTPYYIEIFDETTGALLGSTGFGSSLSVSFTPTQAGDTLVAFVMRFSPTLPLPPPSSIQASSNTLFTELDFLT